MTPKEEYLELLAKLKVLIGQGKDDSPEGDALRDAMDKPWYALTKEEREEVAKA